MHRLTHDKQEVNYVGCNCVFDEKETSNTLIHRILKCPLTRKQATTIKRMIGDNKETLIRLSQAISGELGMGLQIRILKAMKSVAYLEK